MSDVVLTLADFPDAQSALEHVRARTAALVANYPPGKPTQPPCGDCSWPFDHYMLTDDTWAAVHPEGRAGYLCLGCSAARLGRPLAPSDFIAYPTNLSIAFGYALGSIRCD